MTRREEDVERIPCIHDIYKKRKEELLGDRKIYRLRENNLGLFLKKGASNIGINNERYNLINCTFEIPKGILLFWHIRCGTKKESRSIVERGQATKDTTIVVVNKKTSNRLVLLKIPKGILLDTCVRLKSKQQNLVVTEKKAETKKF